MTVDATRHGTRARTRQVNVYEAKTVLSQLIDEVRKSTIDIVIARNNRPVARLTRLTGETAHEVIRDETLDLLRDLLARVTAIEHRLDQDAALRAGSVPASRAL